MGKKKKSLVSCFECIAAKSCYGIAPPDLEKTRAREKAAACTSVRKGFSTETIKVAGATRGVSRKKAEKLTEQGKAFWKEDGTIERTDQVFSYAQA